MTVVTELSVVEEKATQTVPEQAESLSREWAVA